MTTCNLQEHVFEKGGVTVICSKCSKTFEDYQKDLMAFIDEYRAKKKS